ncbi:hypothetical protein [Erythrobacter rubeus]|uniref:Uncharacterized protein n=1 Tax=Erythrobacter rubeus TaxID=2760803 RepID=A0ABR8KVN9_9SPHN|nr:hypothetical protein [Erythrobacter rubeus]MBD2843472.1 hypothetical protein [Erythrobacter rubeus]
MSRIANQSLAVCAALFLTLSSIGTIVTVPPAQAQVSQSFPAMVELA